MGADSVFKVGFPPNQPATTSFRRWLKAALEADGLDAHTAAIMQDASDDWVISKPLAGLLTRLILEQKCRSVLEFGAGLSSRVLASALSRAGGGRLTSVEHEPRFSRKNWLAAKAMPAVDVELVVSRLALRISSYGLAFGYPDADDKLAARGPFDLVLIDAPPGRYGREGSLYTAYPYLRPGGIVILDDAARTPERTALRRWLIGCPGLELAGFSASFGRGTAVLVHNGDKTRRWVLRTAAGTVHDVFASLLRR